MEKFDIILFGVNDCSQISAKINPFGSGHVILRNYMRIASYSWDDNTWVVHTGPTDFDALSSIIDDDQLFEVNFGLYKFALICRVVRSSELRVIRRRHT